MKKQLAILLAVLSMASVSALATACGEDKPAPDTGSSDTGSVDTGSSDTGSSGSDDVVQASDLELVASVRALTLKAGEEKKVGATVYHGDDEFTGVTFRFESSDTTVATVAEDGTVKGLKKGTATITVSASWLDEALEPATIAVTVEETLTLDTGVEGDKLSLCTAEQEGVQKEYTVTPTVTLNGQTVENAAFTLTSADESVVKCENGKIVAVGKGTTTVTVKYVSELGSEVTGEIAVSVSLPVLKERLNDRTISLHEAFEVETEATLTGVQSAFIGEDEFPVELREGKIVVDLSSLGGSLDERSVVITADAADATYVYTVKIVAYDFIMDDKADFDAFIAHISEGKHAYAMLSANIDYKGAVISHNSQSEVSPAVTFYLDGQGHSISNVSTAAKRGLFGDTGNNITLKNIAFVDLDAQAGNTAGGLFVELSNATLSNVYVNMTMYLVTGAPIALGANANVKMENVVTHITEVNGDANTFGSVSWDKKTPHGGLTTMGAYNNEQIYKNCYSIHPWASVMTKGTSKVENGAEVSDNPLAYTEGLYKSLVEFKAAVTTLPEGFSADLWKINTRGELVLKDAAPREIETMKMVANDYTTLYDMGMARVEIALLDGTFTPEGGDQQWFTGDGAGYCHINGLVIGAAAGMLPTDSYAKLMDYIVITTKDGVAKTANEYIQDNIANHRYQGYANELTLNEAYAPVFVRITENKIRIDISTLVKVDGQKQDGPFKWGEFSITLLAKNAAGEPLTLHTQGGVVTLETDLTYGFNADGGFVKQ